MTNRHEIADARFEDHMRDIERVKRDLLPPLTPPDDHMPPDELVLPVVVATVVLAVAVPTLAVLAVVIGRGLF